MPEVTDQGAESTVAVIADRTDEMQMTEEQILDAQASSQLATLFINLKKLRRSRPKPPSEAKVMPAIVFDPESIGVMVTEWVEEFTKWVHECEALLFSIRDLGDANPGANIHLVGRDGRNVQTNGTKLYEALLRTESQILAGALASGG